MRELGWKFKIRLLLRRWALYYITNYYITIRTLVNSYFLYSYTMWHYSCSQTRNSIGWYINNKYYFNSDVKNLKVKYIACTYCTYIYFHIRYKIYRGYGLRKQYVPTIYELDQVHYIIGLHFRILDSLTTAIVNYNNSNTIEIPIIHGVLLLNSTLSM